MPTRHSHALAELLHELAAAGLDPGAVLDRAALRVAELVGDGVSIRPLSSDGQWLEPGHGTHRDPAKRRPHDVRQPADEGVTAGVLATGGSVLLADLDDSSISPLYREYVEQVGISSIMVVPLRGHAAILGTLTLTRDRDSPVFTPEDLRLAELLADRIGLMLDNARLHAAVERQAARQAAIGALGERALLSDHEDELVALAVRTVREVLRPAAAGLEAFAVPSSPARLTALIPGRHASHGVLWVEPEPDVTPDADDAGFLRSIAALLGVALDRRVAEQEMRRRGLHDPLTGLPNRTVLQDRIAHALARSQRTEGDHVAVLFLDIDRFKVVNDSLGHRAGDQLLRGFAERLRRAVRPGDTVARFGGDEFVVLCEQVDDEAMALRIAGRLAEALRAPFRLDGGDHVVCASVGVVLRAGGHEDADDLLRDADAAMYRAKEHGRGRVELFDAGMRERAVGRLQTEASLRRALAGEELDVAYQPVVSLRDGAVTAVEALARWDHPVAGRLEPADFIAVAEESGLIVPLGERVLELACEQAAAWARARGAARPVPVHVNVSARQLRDPGFVTTVVNVLQRTGLPSAALVLEITEGTLVDEAPDLLEALRALRALGAGVVLDDFGTGWSSLSYLQRFPITGLKVDRSFVAALGGGGQTPIVDAILRMAKALGLDVIAEGVETRAQRTALEHLGCPQGQGWLFATALSAADVTRFVLGGPAPSPAHGPDRPAGTAA